MTYEERTRRVRNALVTAIVMLFMMLWLLTAARHAGPLAPGGQSRPDSLVGG